MKEVIKTMLPLLDEKQRRLFLASCANSIGRGGLKQVCEISGASKNTVIKGQRELKYGISENDNRVRKKGGGRKMSKEINPKLLEWIEAAVTCETYGNPENPLLWTTKSLRKIQDVILSEHQIYVSHSTVAVVLSELGYSLQSNQKMLQKGEPHPDRNAQFEHINKTAKVFLEEGQPVISVDTKKKENIGNFKNNGQEYRKIRDPRKVLDHDFPIDELGKVAPYGVYVLNDNTAFVNLGTSHDTAEFAVESISRWWETTGINTFPNATKLMINCDSGGSNGYRNRLWKAQLQEFSNRTGLTLTIAHFPPGTSKWNKIEHRLFCFISANWKGKPLDSVETVINLISNTVTTKGLTVICQKDDNIYPLAQKVSNEVFEAICIEKIPPLGNWNYIIFPNK